MALVLCVAIFAMTESDFMRRCMKRASDLGARLFRMNIGTAWVGDANKLKDGSILIRNPRPFHSGVPGMSDLVGWVPVQITPDMVGKTVAVYAAVETKSLRGKALAQQKNFILAVEKSGGRAGVARTDADLDNILCGSIFGGRHVDRNSTN